MRPAEMVQTLDGVGRLHKKMTFRQLQASSGLSEAETDA